MLGAPMSLGSVNLLAVALSSLVAFGLNFVWFNILFRASYIAGLGRSQAQLDRGPSLPIAAALQLAGYVVMALVLAWLMQRTGNLSAGGGLKLAIILWLGVVVALLGPRYAFEAYSFTFFLINVGGPLAALLSMGIILGAWR